MIAIINVRLTRGDLSNPSHLRDLADLIYRRQVPLPPNTSLQGLQTRVAGMVHAAVYTCVPQPGSQAAFMYLTAREFEIVIETSHQGHLIRSSESVSRELRHRLAQRDMLAEITISLLEPNDNQTYIYGSSISIYERLRAELKDNFVAIAIATVLVFISGIWLDQYLQESIAVLVGLFLFTLWEVYTVIAAARNRSINWRIHE